MTIKGVNQALFYPTKWRWKTRARVTPAPIWI